MARVRSSLIPCWPWRFQAPLVTRRTFPLPCLVDLTDLLVTCCEEALELELLLRAEAGATSNNARQKILHTRMVRLGLRKLHLLVLTKWFSPAPGVAG